MNALVTHTVQPSIPLPAPTPAPTPAPAQEPVTLLFRYGDLPPYDEDETEDSLADPFDDRDPLGDDFVGGDSNSFHGDGYDTSRKFLPKPNENVSWARPAYHCLELLFLSHCLLAVSWCVLLTQHFCDNMFVYQSTAL